MSARRAEMWIAPVGLIDGRIAPAEAAFALAVELEPVERTVPENTILLALDGREAPLRLLDAERRELWSGRAPLAELLEGRVLADPLRRGLAAALPPAEAARLGSWAPAFYASWDGDGGRVHLHGRVRLGERDALFVRTSPEQRRWEGAALAGPAGAAAPWLTEAARLHAHDPLFLNNHQCYYRKCHAGVELEHKLTLLDPAADIWELTALAHRGLLAGRLPGYLPEYGDDHQAWDFLNHLFEVRAPEPERGYVSYLPTTDGLHTIKRKWYAEDALARRERHYRGVEVALPLERDVAERFGVEARRLPSFRRVRYDVNLESARTGHVYGIMFDHCSLLERPDVTLLQCEVEYLRTRSVLAPDADAIEPELAELAAWSEALLDAQGVPYRRDFYSKLSFLRDAVAARPELAGASA